MLDIKIDKEYSFSIENFFGYKSLVSVKSLRQSHVREFTGDIVYAEKLDGHRGVFLQTLKKSYVEFENGRRLEMERLSQDVFVLDVEYMDEGPIVCDVLYYNRPVYNLTMEARLKLVKDYKIQTYYPLKEFKEITNAEGYIFLNSINPYDRLSIYKFKYEQTVDLLRVTSTQVRSSDGRLYDAVESANTGMIEELTLDLKNVLRVRDDKLIPNHSSLMAVDDLASIKDIEMSVTRKGLSVKILKNGKVTSLAEDWLAVNVTEVGPMENVYEDDCPEEELFPFDVMDKEGNFTPEYEEYKLRYFETKSTQEAYVQAIQPDDYEEVVQSESEDFKAQILLDEKYIEPVEKGYLIQGKIFKNITDMHPISLFDSVPEIRRIIDKFFEKRAKSFGTIIKCDKHNQYCASQMGCVRKYLFYQDTIYDSVVKCTEHDKCVRVADRCLKLGVLTENIINQTLKGDSVKVKKPPDNRTINSSIPKRQGNNIQNTVKPTTKLKNVKKKRK